MDSGPGLSDFLGLTTRKRGAHIWGRESGCSGCLCLSSASPQRSKTWLASGFQDPREHPGNTCEEGAVSVPMGSVVSAQLNRHLP